MITAMSPPLVKLLYRSLLRWTLRPEVARSRFVLPVLEEQLARRWPVDGVRNASGVRRAVRAGFRTPLPGVTLPPAQLEEWQQSQLSDGFTLLKQLQEFTQQIEEIVKLREKNAVVRREIGAPAAFRYHVLDE